MLFPRFTTAFTNAFAPAPSVSLFIISFLIQLPLQVSLFSYPPPPSPTIASLFFVPLLPLLIRKCLAIAVWKSTCFPSILSSPFHCCGQWLYLRAQLLGPLSCPIFPFPPPFLSSPMYGSLCVSLGSVPLVVSQLGWFPAGGQRARGVRGEGSGVGAGRLLGCTLAIEG